MKISRPPVGRCGMHKSYDNYANSQSYACEFPEIGENAEFKHAFDMADGRQTGSSEIRALNLKSLPLP